MSLWQRVNDAKPKNGCGRAYYYADDGEYERRMTFRETFGFAVPSPPAIQAIREFVGQRKVLEVGAGSGVWARLLSDEGVTVTAVDNRSGKYSISRKVGAYFPVKRRGAVSAIRKYRSHEALMLCWPDYDTPMASTSLTEFRGDRVIYIGESESGCTGDRKFHKLLGQWKLVDSIAIPQWPGIDDELSLYERWEPDA